MHNQAIIFGITSQDSKLLIYSLLIALNFYNTNVKGTESKSNDTYLYYNIL